MTPVKRSLFGKLIRANLAVILAVFVTLFVSISYLMEFYFHQAKQKELVANAAKLAGNLSLFNQLEDNVAAAAVISTFQQFTGTTVWVGDAGGPLIMPAGDPALWAEADDIDVLAVLARVDDPDDDEEPFSYRSVHPETDQPLLSVALPITYGRNRTAVLYMHAPLVGVRTTIGAVRRLLLSAGLISLFAAGVVSYVSASRISGPLSSMNKVAQAIAAGDLRGRVEVLSDDEVGRLGDSFNRMALRLQETVDERARQEKLRKEFIADVAHELRTPLTSVRGFLEAIADGIARDKQEADEYVRIAIEETERLQRLAETLLKVSRIDAGGEPFEPVPVALAAVVGGAVDKIAPQALARDVTVRFNPEPGVPLVRADEEKVERIVLNLLDNALHHTPPGGRIDVSARMSSEPTAAEHGAFVEVSVRDTGPGIPPEEHPYIWERFYKVDKARRKAAGSGLGLVIVRQLVELHGGAVSLHSEPGRGADFRFTLPALKRTGLGGGQ